MTARVTVPRTVRSEGELAEPPELLRDAEPLATAFELPPGDWRCYYGNLHAHTSISDGEGTPAEAFMYARDNAAVNFLCLSEHNHYAGTTDAALAAAQHAADQAGSSDFVGIVGQEFSTIENGNHVNVFDVTDKIAKSFNNDYRALFTEWLPAYAAENPERVVVCQFNHPKDVDADYGAVAYSVKVDGQPVVKPNWDGDFESFRRNVDPWVSTIAVISGPADPNLGPTASRPLNVHRDTEAGYLRAWKNYLDRGFHLEPRGRPGQPHQDLGQSHDRTDRRLDQGAVQPQVTAGGNPRRPDVRDRGPRSAGVARARRVPDGQRGTGPGQP